MSKSILDNNLSFLSGGGEMGALMRAKDWRNTDVGCPETWSQSLRITLGIILNSKFPMFLFWGDHLTCFYNDAYRPSLGNNGKHPAMLGQRAVEGWPDIWSFIKPIIDQVLSGGEAWWSENQLLPIIRNGKLEDVYWTFSYSPVKDETGKIVGVFVACSETTQHVKNERELIKSVDNLNNIILQAPVAMCILKGPSFIVEIANERMYQLWGKPKELVANKPVFEAIPEAKDSGLQEILDHTLTTGHTFHANSLPITLPRNGIAETVYVNFVYEAYRELDGSITGVMAVAYEVTEQVAASKKIEESEKRFRLLADQVPQFIWMTGMDDNNITYINKTFLTFLNTSLVTRQVNMWDKIAHPDDYAILQKIHQSAFAIRKPYKFECRLKAQDSTDYNWYLVHAVPRYSAENDFTGFIGTGIDITEREVAEEGFKKSTAEFKNLLETMPQMSWTNLPNGNVTYFNQQWYDYTGLDFEQSKNWGWEIVIHPEDLEFVTKIYLRAIAEGNMFVSESRFKSKDGLYRWFLSRALPIKNKEGEIILWAGTATDIHDQKVDKEKLVIAFKEVEESEKRLEMIVEERTKEVQEAKNFLQQKNIDLEKLNIELESFAYVASHDLQEPLRKIQTFSKRILLLDADSLSVTGKDYFARMDSAANRMQALIHDLLSYSLTSKAKKDFVLTDLNQIIAFVQEDLKEAILEKGAILKVGKLGNVKIIPFQFRQLISNLVTNSLKFSRPDRIPHISIMSSIVKGADILYPQLVADKNYTKISIVDNGIGFDGQYAEKIFEMFQRLHGKDEYKGTGIGLAIVKKIVENHNGLIAAKSIEGEGAQFDIYLPLVFNAVLLEV